MPIASTTPDPTASANSSQDDERRRIGREEAGEHGRAVDAAPDKACSLLGRSLQELRTLTDLLHLPLLDEPGLASAIRW